MIAAIKKIKGMEDYDTPTMITTTEDGRAMVNFLRREPKIALDMQGIQLGLEGTITLIQIQAFSSGGVYLCDVLLCPELPYILKGILENENIVKIMHDCRADRANLFKQYHINLRGVFDTQIAYKFVKKEMSQFRIGWFSLLKAYKLQSSPMRSLYHGIYKTIPDVWKQRPLTEALKALASMDLKHLDTLYITLKDQIPQEDEARFQRECEEAVQGADSSALY